MRVSVRIDEARDQDAVAAVDHAIARRGRGSAFAERFDAVGAHAHPAHERLAAAAHHQRIAQQERARSSFDRRLAAQRQLLEVTEHREERHAERRQDDD